MKKGAALVLAVLSGIITIGVVNLVLELMNVYVPMHSFIVLGVAIYAGVKTHKLLCKRWGIEVETGDKVQMDDSSIRAVLYFALILQFTLSMGVANEYEDYVIMAIISAFFFLVQIWSIIRVRSSKRAFNILISLLSLWAVFSLIAFVQDGPGIISNKYPEEVYYSTRNGVILMLSGRVMLEIVKLLVLNRKFIFRKNEHNIKA